MFQNIERFSSFLNGILSSGFLPAITLPTRASNNSTLIIDNVFVNQQAEFNFLGILENEISDHQAVVVNTKLILPHTKTRYITIYSNSEEAKNNFKNDIISKNIFDRLNKNLTNNPNENYNILEEEISNSLEIHISGVARGGRGGHLPPGAARRGAPKSCPNFFLI